jgi:hypothetical protein
MKLIGSHADVSCNKCHPSSRFNLKTKNPDFCGNCHKSPHNGHLFDKKDCDWCHSPTMSSMRQHSFDHARRTKFEQTGAHKKVGCYECHTKSLGAKVPKRVCEACHDDDNVHQNRFSDFGKPPRCDACHPQTSFKDALTFNHNARTSFALRGKHQRASCRGCHRGKNAADFERFDPAKVGCMGCHAHAKVHDGQFKDAQCLECHQTEGSRMQTAESVDIYHGPDSQFPLVDGHEGVDCTSCHIDDQYKGTPRECGSRCHEDVHETKLGDACSQCHRPGVWEPERFDHAEDTQWPLKGMHQEVKECESCHKGDITFQAPTTCSAEGCHATDDVHKGKLGDACEKCHNESGENLFNHNTMAAFKLNGSHMAVKCSQCHPSISFKPRPKNCAGCHPEPQVHKGQYGTVCETCHTTETWLDIRALHDVGDFALKGAHDNLTCQRCHKDNRPLGGSGNLCINCHRRDDIHSNSLSPRCGQCHSQWSFTPAQFDHSTVGCYLTGLHRTLACYDCHKTGSFGGLASDCASCHRDTAIEQRPATHANRANSCATVNGCHTPNTWKVLGAYPSESICR